MKLKALFLFCLAALVSPITSKAQNLVPNPGFEIYNFCPTNISGISYSAAYTNFPTVTQWVTPLLYTTPDYFNTCSTGGYAGMPHNLFGYQQPHGGNGAAGIVAWEGQYNNGNLTLDYREYLQCKLKQELRQGHQYCVSFYVSPSISQQLNFNYVAIDALGLNFSATRATSTNDYTLSLPYSVSNQTGNFITDTSKWIKISGVYTATGGELWLTIGCFNNTNHIPAYIPVYPATINPALNKRAYLYVDDVNVLEITAADTTKYIHDTLICGYNRLFLGLTSSSIDGPYTWNTGATTRSINALTPGTYWCASSKDCGVVIDSFHIVYPRFFKLDLGNDTVNCENKPITLKANYGYLSYLWNNGMTTDNITVTTGGTYKLTVTDLCGTQTDSVHVAIQPPTPKPVVADTNICQYAPVTDLRVEGTDLRWYLSPDLLSYDQKIHFTTEVPGVYTFYVTQTIGKCESEPEQMNIRVRYKPQVKLDDITICEHDTVTYGKPYPEVSYHWNTGDTTCCIVPHKEAVYALTISNACGTSTDAASINFSVCDLCVAVPNAFTPNGDSKNDYFTVKLVCPVKDYRIQIYNRWGQRIFRSYDPNFSWDGTTDGKLSDMGIYVYTMEYTSMETGNRQVVQGNVTLIK